MTSLERSERLAAIGVPFHMAAAEWQRLPEMGHVPLACHSRHHSLLPHTLLMSLISMTCLVLEVFCFAAPAVDDKGSGRGLHKCASVSKSDDS